MNFSTFAWLNSVKSTVQSKGILVCTLFRKLWNVNLKGHGKGPDPIGNLSS